MDIQHARKIATKFHVEQEGQTYEDRCYVEGHLDKVVSVLSEFGYRNEPILCGGYLHDLVEDTDASLGLVRQNFGTDVATIVEFCTDAEGASRRERKGRTLKRWMECLQTPEKWQHGVSVKICDRIANVRSCVLNRNLGLLKTYRKEMGGFREVLDFGAHSELWNELESLFEITDEFLL